MENFKKQEDIKNAVSEMMKIILKEKLLYQLSIPRLTWMTNHLEMYLNCLLSGADVSIKVLARSL